jgi:glycerol-3-phosphate acyltransferase PlsY
MSIEWQLPALIALAGYFMGSIPFGVVLTRLAGAGDLRTVGSGNIGATNVLRTGRKGLAAATVLLLPEGAGAVPGGIIGGLMAFVGHCYPIWLRFRGGKGVATMLGVCLGLSWIIGLAFAIVWLGALALARISSVSGMSAAISAPIVAALCGQIHLAPALGAMALVILWRHKDNIARLLRGHEPRVGRSREG